MRTRKRKERGDDLIGSIKPKLLENLLELLVKIIGDTLKDKLARAALIGVVGAFGQYAHDLAGQAPLVVPAPATITTPAILPTRNDNAPQ